VLPHSKAGFAGMKGAQIAFRPAEYVWLRPKAALRYLFARALDDRVFPKVRRIIQK